MNGKILMELFKLKGVDIIEFEEKPVVRSYINAGVYILEPSSN
jgi:NDP-sugar pyrophosphorylase family protein